MYTLHDALGKKGMSSLCFLCRGTSFEGDRLTLRQQRKSQKKTINFFSNLCPLPPPPLQSVSLPPARVAWLRIVYFRVHFRRKILFVFFFKKNIVISQVFTIRYGATVTAALAVVVQPTAVLWPLRLSRTLRELQPRKKSKYILFARCLLVIWVIFILSSLALSRHSAFWYRPAKASRFGEPAVHTYTHSVYVCVCNIRKPCYDFYFL